MISRLKKFYRIVHIRETGFTLIELLVVIAILGFIAGVAVPRLAQFVGSGESEAIQTELRNIQTAVTVMLTESTTGNLSPISGVSDMDTVATTDLPALILSDYLTGLETDGTVKTGYIYSFTANGTVTQTVP